jgi:hypothetical protein
LHDLTEWAASGSRALSQQAALVGLHVPEHSVPESAACIVDDADFTPTRGRAFRKRGRSIARDRDENRDILNQRSKTLDCSRNLSLYKLVIK